MNVKNKQKKIIMIKIQKIFLNKLKQNKKIKNKININFLNLIKIK